MIGSRAPHPAAPSDPLGVARRVARVLRRIIGVPDYDGYVAHVHTHHPGDEPMSEREFLRARLVARYATPGNRCC